MKQNKPILPIAFALAGGMIGAVVATQMGASGALAATENVRTIRAERFVVVGPNGEDRISMQVTGHGIADIALSDANGRNRAEIRVTPEGAAGLGFYDADGAKRLVTCLTGENSAGIAIYSSTGRQLMAMAAKDDDETAFTLYDPNSGLARVGLGVGSNGSPALVMFNKAGKEGAELSLSKNDKPNLLMVDNNGKTITAAAEPEQQLAGRR